MSSLQIVKWVPWDEACPGGLFSDAGSWDDEHIALIEQAIIRGEAPINGREHQHGECGAPVFSDGASSTFSMRQYGGIVAEALNRVLGQEHYNYADFAWSDDDWQAEQLAAVKRLL